jgi:hypothetical protein
MSRPLPPDVFDHTCPMHWRQRNIASEQNPLPSGMLSRIFIARPRSFFPPPLLPPGLSHEYCIPASTASPLRQEPHHQNRRVAPVDSALQRLDDRAQAAPLDVRIPELPAPGSQQRPDVALVLCLQKLHFVLGENVKKVLVRELLHRNRLELRQGDLGCIQIDRCDLGTLYEIVKDVATCGKNVGGNSAHCPDEFVARP